MKKRICLLLIMAIIFNTSVMAISTQTSNEFNVSTVINYAESKNEYTVHQLESIRIHRLKCDDYVFAAQEVNNKLHYAIRYADEPEIHTGTLEITDAMKTNSHGYYETIVNGVKTSQFNNAKTAIAIEKTNTANIRGTGPTIEYLVDLYIPAGEYPERLEMSVPYNGTVGMLYRTRSIYIDEISRLYLGAKATVEVVLAFYGFELNKVMGIVSFVYNVAGALETLNNFWGIKYNIEEHDTKIAKFDGVAECYSGHTREFEGGEGELGAYMDPSPYRDVKDPLFDNGKAILDRGYEYYIS